MANQIAVLTDTNSGITEQEGRRLNIFTVAMPVIISGESYLEGQTIDPATFYRKLRAGASVGTSQPAPGQMIDVWERLLEKYGEVIYIPMSAGLSGSMRTARALASAYGQRVRVVDNRRISVTLRQSVLEAKHMADKGLPADEIVEYLEKDGRNASIYLAVSTLRLLKKSGRVTPAAAALGAIMNIMPVLQIQGDKLDAFERVRGMDAAMESIIHGLETDRHERFPGQPVTIRAAYSGEEADGEAWRLRLQEAFPDLTVEKDPLPISVVCHTGEGALGAGIMRDIF